VAPSRKPQLHQSEDARAAMAPKNPKQKNKMLLPPPKNTQYGFQLASYMLAGK